MNLGRYLLPGSGSILGETLASSGATNQQLVAIIKADPLLAWHLYRSARANIPDKSRTIQGVNHVINLFGFGLLQTVLGQKKELVTDDKQLKACLAISFYGAHLSAALLPDKHGTTAERFFLPTLVYAMELTAYYQQSGASAASLPAKEARAWLLKSEAQVHKNTLNDDLPTLTERSLVLKFSRCGHWLKDIRRASGEPEKVKELLAQSLKDKRIFDNQETGIYLIIHSLIALYFDKEERYLERLFALLAAHLEKTPRQLQEELRRQADIIHSDYFTSEISLGQKLNSQNWFTAPGNPEDGELVDKDFFEASVKQLTNNSGKFSKGQLLALARSAITRGIGAENCTILVFNAQIQLKTFGKDGRQLLIEKKQLGQLFTQLLQKPAAQQLTQENLAQAFNILPSPWLKDWQPKPSSFGTITGKRPLGIAYADHDSWQTSHHQYFLQICKLLNKALSE